MLQCEKHLIWFYSNSILYSFISSQLHHQRLPAENNVVLDIEILLSLSRGCARNCPLGDVDSAHFLVLGRGGVKEQLVHGATFYELKRCL